MCSAAQPHSSASCHQMFWAVPTSDSASQRQQDPAIQPARPGRPQPPRKPGGNLLCLVPWAEQISRPQSPRHCRWVWCWQPSTARRWRATLLSVVPRRNHHQLSLLLPRLLLLLPAPGCHPRPPGVVADCWCPRRSGVWWKLQLRRWRRPPWQSRRPPARARGHLQRSMRPQPRMTSRPSRHSCRRWCGSARHRCRRAHTSWSTSLGRRRQSVPRPTPSRQRYEHELMRRPPGRAAAARNGANARGGVRRGGPRPRATRMTAAGSARGVAAAWPPRRSAARQMTPPRHHRRRLRQRHRGGRAVAPALVARARARAAARKVTTLTSTGTLCPTGSCAARTLTRASGGCRTPRGCVSRAARPRPGRS
jgi:hypothetical protein